MSARAFTDIAWALASAGHVPSLAWLQIFAQELLFRMAPPLPLNSDPHAPDPQAGTGAHTQPCLQLTTSQDLPSSLTHASPLPSMDQTVSKTMQAVWFKTLEDHKFPLLQLDSMWEALRRSWLVDPDSLHMLDSVETEATLLLAQRRRDPAWAQQQLGPEQVAVAVWALGVWGFVPVGAKGQATLASMAEVLVGGRV